MYVFFSRGISIALFPPRRFCIIKTILKSIISYCNIAFTIRNVIATIAIHISSICKKKAVKNWEEQKLFIKSDYIFIGYIYFSAGGMAIAIRCVIPAMDEARCEGWPNKSRNPRLDF